MLITVTLNPAMDRTLRVNSFAVNMVLRGTLLRNAPGGKGINVSRSALELGGRTLALFVSGGETGQLIKEKLLFEKIDFRAIDVQDDSRTCYGIIDTEAGTETVINEQGPKLTKEDVRGFKKLFEETVQQDDIVALSGSFPLGVSETIYAELIEIARTKNAKTILDTSGIGLRLGMEAAPFLVKVNRHEIAQVDGLSEPIADSKLINLAKNWIARGISGIVVTEGKWPVFTISNKGKFIVTPPAVTIVNTWGSGDCVVAGIAVYLEQGRSFEEAIRFGVAAGTANTLSYGAGFIKLKDVMALYKSTQVTPL